MGAPKDEVLLIEMGHTLLDEGKKPRLRVMVKTNNGMIGWMSPETTDGDRLLAPVNLLSPKVAEVHRRSLSANSPIKRVSSIGQKPKSPGSSATPPRKSFHMGGRCPWEINGSYRALETLRLRQEPLLSCAEL